MCACVLGLGDHQASAEQHRHLPGRQDEPPSAHWLPAEKEAAGAEERCRAEERMRCHYCLREFVFVCMCACVCEMILLVPKNSLCAFSEHVTDVCGDRGRGLMRGGARRGAKAAVVSRHDGGDGTVLYECTVYLFYICMKTRVDSVAESRRHFLLGCCYFLLSHYFFTLSCLVGSLPVDTVPRWSAPISRLNTHGPPP